MKDENISERYKIFIVLYNFECEQELRNPGFRFNEALKLWPTFYDKRKCIILAGGQFCTFNESAFWVSLQSAFESRKMNSNIILRITFLLVLVATSHAGSRRKRIKFGNAYESPIIKDKESSRNGSRYQICKELPVR